MIHVFLDVFMGALPGMNESSLDGQKKTEATDLCGCLEDCDFNRYETEITMGEIHPVNVKDYKIT